MRARIAPRLGRLSWAKGKAPTPHGFIHVDINSCIVKIDSPVPFALDLPGEVTRQYEAGKYRLSTTND